MGFCILLYNDKQPIPPGSITLFGVVGLYDKYGMLNI